MYHWIPLLKHYTSSLAILLVSLLVNGSGIVGAEEDAVPLSLEQLEEKLEKRRKLLDHYNNISEDYMIRAVRGTNHYNPGEPIFLGSVFSNFRKVINENIENIENQIEHYNEENPDIRNNNQNDNPHNPDLPLPNRHTDTPLYLKIIIGIIAIAFTSLFTIVIWESLPKKKKKKTKDFSSPSLGKYKRG